MRIRIRIRAGQKHADPDPKPCYFFPLIHQKNCIYYNLYQINKRSLTIFPLHTPESPPVATTFTIYRYYSYFESGEVLYFLLPILFPAAAVRKPSQN